MTSDAPRGSEPEQLHEAAELGDAFTEVQDADRRLELVSATLDALRARVDAEHRDALKGTLSPEPVNAGRDRDSDG